MLKVLLKKQLLEFGKSYFMNSKNGKRRSKKKMIGVILLSVFLFSYLIGIFSLLGYWMGSVMIPLNLSWLYFTFSGGLALILGVFGSVFNTYAGIYHAKDNELLLSMPIPPSKLLTARMLFVWLIGFLFESLVYLPAIVVYWICVPGAGEAPVKVAFFQLFSWLAISLLILALTCLLGWLVALISSKLKNKSLITVVLTLAFLGVYIFFCGQAGEFFTTLFEHAEELGETVRNSAYPLYALGAAPAGEWLPMLLLAGSGILLAFLTVLILSLNFIRIVTTKTSDKKKAYQKTEMREGSLRKALFYKEWKHLFSSPTYLLNCGMGVIFAPILIVMLLINRENIQTLTLILDAMGDGLLNLLPVGAFAIILMNASTLDFTAPSVSLEGKTLWILQTMPADSKVVLETKLLLSLTFALPVSLILSVALAWIFQMSVWNAVLIALGTVVFAVLSSEFGLFLNLKSPNLIWTNETMVVKNSFPVMIVLFGGWGVSLLAGVGYYFLRNLMDPNLYLGLCTALFLALTVLLYRWLMTKGAKILSEL